jgi:hypothetical protein
MGKYKDICDIIAKNIENKLQSTEYIEYIKCNGSYYWELIPIIRIMPTLKDSTPRFTHLNAKAKIY